MHKYRAAGDVRTVVNKNKLKIAEPGSVSFNCDRVGLVSVQTDKDEDKVSEIVFLLQKIWRKAKTPSISMTQQNEEAKPITESRLQEASMHQGIKKKT